MKRMQAELMFELLGNEHEVTGMATLFPEMANEVWEADEAADYAASWEELLGSDSYQQLMQLLGISSSCIEQLPKPSSGEDYEFARLFPDGSVILGVAALEEIDGLDSVIYAFESVEKVSEKIEEIFDRV